VDVTRLEERIGHVTFKMAECHRIIKQAEDAKRELESYRAELRKLAAEYVSQTEESGRSRLKQVK